MLILALSLGIRLCATSKVHWSYSTSFQMHTSSYSNLIFVSLAQLLAGFLHDLPKDFPICSAKAHFLKNIRIFSLAQFQLPFLLSPGSSLSCFLKKHSGHQSPYADYLPIRRNLPIKTPLHHQTHPLQWHLGKMSTMIVSKQKDLYLFDLCWSHESSLLLEIMHLYRSWTLR